VIYFTWLSVKMVVTAIICDMSFAFYKSERW
jgi:hypothetical protein